MRDIHDEWDNFALNVLNIDPTNDKARTLETAFLMGAHSMICLLELLKQEHPDITGKQEAVYKADSIYFIELRLGAISAA